MDAGTYEAFGQVIRGVECKTQRPDRKLERYVEGKCSEVTIRMQDVRCMLRLAVAPASMTMRDTDGF